MKTNTEDKTEHCVLCGNETPYTIYDEIDLRDNYIEGAGQLCSNCYSVTYPKIQKIRYGG